MNSTNKSYLHARNLSYQCDNYASYTLVGEDYTEKKQIIQVNFTYGMKEDKKILRIYKVQDENKKEFVKNFRIYEVNMDRIMNYWYDKNEKEIEKYKYLIMLDLSLKELEKLSKKDRMVEKYKMYVEIINDNPDFPRRISEEQDRIMILNTEKILAREEGHEEGRQEGIKEGKKEGIKEGIKTGKKEGIKEGIRKKALETAKELLLLKVEIDKIVKSTGLTLEEVEKLKED